MSKEKNIHVLPIGTTIQGTKHAYTIVEVLGQGGFGIPYKVVTEDGQTLALKEHFVKSRCFRGNSGVDMAFLDTASDEVKGSIKEFKREGKLLVKISDQCPNIVKVYEVFEANNTVYYSMEYLAGGNLRNIVRKGGRLKEDAARQIMEPIAEALTYLHRNKILHMDIKPDNIVMRIDPETNTQTPVLIDFGVSLHFDDQGDLTTTHHIVGVTRGFSPIEQYEQVKHFSPVIDIYALSATWFYLLAGHNPLAATEIKREWILQNLPNDVSDITRNTIADGMAFRADERPQNVKEFLQLLEGQITMDIGQRLKKSHRSLLLKRLAIAAGIIIAAAGVVVWGMKNCGGEKTAQDNDSIQTPLKTTTDTTTIQPIVNHSYELTGIIGKDSTFEKGTPTTIYITISKNNRVKGTCQYNGYAEGMTLTGFLSDDELELSEYFSNKQRPNGIFIGKFSNNTYKGTYSKFSNNNEDNEDNATSYFFFDEVKEIVSPPKIAIAKWKAQSKQKDQSSTQDDSEDITQTPNATSPSVINEKSDNSSKTISPQSQETETTSQIIKDKPQGTDEDEEFDNYIKKRYRK